MISAGCSAEIPVSAGTAAAADNLGPGSGNPDRRIPAAGCFYQDPQM